MTLAWESWQSIHHIHLAGDTTQPPIFTHLNHVYMCAFVTVPLIPCQLYATDKFTYQLKSSRQLEPGITFP